MGAQISQETLSASRLPCHAEPSSVLNQTVRKIYPLVLWNNLHQIYFDLLRVLFLG